MKLSTAHFSKLLLMSLSAALLVGHRYDSKVTNSSYELASSDLSSLISSSEADDGDSSPVAPVISHALDVVGLANSSLPRSLTNFSSDKNCSDCEKQVANMRYEQCRAKDSYFEDKLQRVSEKQGLLGDLLRQPVNPNSIIKPICMQMSLELGRSSLRQSAFRSCNGTRIGRAVGSPCVSENYFKLINNSFDLASSCMKSFISGEKNEEMQNLDVRAVYALVNHESSFHVNVVSETGAGGIGQFTSAALADVNANQLAAVRQSLESNINPACGRISKEMLSSNQPIKAEAQNSCERTSLENGNPLKNMIYTFAYLRGTKRDLDKQIFNNTNYKNKFSNLSEFDLARIRRAMMVWSHNTGLAGTLTPTKALLNLIYRRKPVTDADAFINQLQQFMQKFPARGNSRPARRLETSRYFPAITNKLHNLETNAGGGSCVNN